MTTIVVVVFVCTIRDNISIIGLLLFSLCYLSCFTVVVSFSTTSCSGVVVVIIIATLTTRMVMMTMTVGTDNDGN